MNNLLKVLARISVILMMMTSRSNYQHYSSMGMDGGATACCVK